MRGRTRPIESPARWLGTVPVAPDGTARITIDGGKLLNLTPRETVGSGGAMWSSPPAPIPRRVKVR